VFTKEKQHIPPKLLVPIPDPEKASTVDAAIEQELRETLISTIGIVYKEEEEGDSFSNNDGYIGFSGVDMEWE
jgi:hypothetical protein